MLVLVHDPVSLASACAWLRLQRLADRGHAIEFEGFDTSGFDVTLPPSPAQHEEFAAHVERARGLGLDARAPTCRPPTARLHLLGTLAEANGLGGSWREVTHRAFWEDGRDVNDPTVLVDLATRAGLDVDAATAALGDSRALATLRRRMRERRAGGVGGVPVLDHRGTLLSPDVPDEALVELAAT